MARETVILKARDCLSFDNQNGHANAFQYFVSKQSKMNILHFAQSYKIEELEIASFNPKDASWRAGRMVGEANFTYDDKDYKIRIEPRFGQVQLFRMLEEIYNIRFSDSKSTLDKEIDYQLLIKRLIAFMWLSMLAQANKHGLPRTTVLKVHKGTTIKGRLNLRKSIIPYYTENQVVSEYREKQPDQVVAKILYKAYEILRLEYGVAKIKQPNATRNAIEQVKACLISDGSVSDYDYQSLKLKSIYASFKSIIDLSWDIIKKKEFGNKDSARDGQSFFIDMAELWEIYLRSILKKRFISEGWIISSPNNKVYQGKDYSRLIIPDIVMKRGRDTLVFDAKYKQMNYRYFDYDRADFFQIHTYINYYQQKQNVIVGGLIYPLSEHFSKTRKDSNYTKTLYNEGTNKTRFIVDGIDFSQINEENIYEEEMKFLNRISSLIKE